MFAKNRLKEDSVDIHGLLKLYAEEKVDSLYVVNTLYEAGIAFREMSYLSRVIDESKYFNKFSISTNSFKKEVDFCKKWYLQDMSGEGIAIEDKDFTQLIEYLLFDRKVKTLLDDYRKIKNPNKFWEYVEAISNQIKKDLE